MSHQVINIPPDLPKSKEKVRVVRKIKNIYKTHIPIFVDSLVLLTISFWYFFFTGLAILFNRKLPRNWLKIATNLSRGKIAEYINKLGKKQKLNKYKVVDLGNKKTIYDGTMQS